MNKLVDAYHCYNAKLIYREYDVINENISFIIDLSFQHDISWAEIDSVNLNVYFRGQLGYDKDVMPLSRYIEKVWYNQYRGEMKTKEPLIDWISDIIYELENRFNENKCCLCGQFKMDKVCLNCY